MNILEKLFNDTYNYFEGIIPVISKSTKFDGEFPLWFNEGYSLGGYDFHFTVDNKPVITLTYNFNEPSSKNFSILLYGKDEGDKDYYLKYNQGKFNFTVDLEESNTVETAHTMINKIYQELNKINDIIKKDYSSIKRMYNL